MNALTAYAVSNAALSDNEYFIGGGTGTGTPFYRIPTSRMWDYIENKISTELGISALSGGASETVTPSYGSNSTQIATTAFVHDAIKNGVEYIESTQTAKTSDWTGVTRDSTLYPGKVIAYKLLQDPNSSATLNLTLADGTTTGAIAVYMNSTRVTTHFAKNTVVLYVYDGTYWRTFDYNTNTNDTSTGYYRYANGTFVTKTALYRYELLLSIDETTVVPINTTSNSPSSTTKVLTQELFDPFRPIYYYSTTSTVSANAAIGASYLWRGRSDVNLGYSFNTYGLLTSNKDVYMVARMMDSHMAQLATDVGPIVQELPTEDDGYIYILLGHAYSTTNITLYTHHPIYIYKGGGIRLYTQATNSTLVKEALNVTSTTANKFLKDTGEWEQVDCGDLTGAADLQAIEALEGTSGFLKKTAANTWTLDTNDYMTEMYMAEYGSSTYAEVLAAYQAKKIVYCRVDKRMAFMAYVNNSTTPTEFEFQYYRSVATHEDNQQGDQVFVYKLTNASGGTWTTTTREAYTKITNGTNVSKSYSNGTLTLSAADPTVKQTAKTDNVNYKLLMSAQSSPTSGSAYEAVYDTNITVNPSTHTITATNFAGNATTATTATTAGNVTGVVAITNGGTGATSAADARTNLGLGTIATANSGDYVLKAGDTMTGNLGITFGDTDKFLIFDYDGDGSAGASWRFGALGSGSNDTNYLVMQSGTSTTSATTWNTALRIGQNTYDAGFAGNVYPITTNSKSLGTSSLKWSNVYGIVLYGGNFTIGGTSSSSANTISSSESIYYNVAASGAAHLFQFGGSTKMRIEASTFAFRPETDNTLSIGTSSKKWASMYATTFYGALSGNASSATKVAATLADTTKTYLLGTSTAITGTAANVDLLGDTGVYLTTTTGELSAAQYSINSGGTEKVKLQYNSISQSLDFIFV